jgi:hypothetical protein
MRVEAVIENKSVELKTQVAPILLTPNTVERMIARRQAQQIVRFRTTCTDCVPNM